jgi:hypothetical protein
MKLIYCLVLIMAGAALSSSSFAGELKSKNGTLSLGQAISCDSREQNLSITITGDQATVESNDEPGEYTCTGSITSTTADLVCNANPGQEVPKIFTLSASPGLNHADYTSSGTPGVSHGECQF